MIQNLKFVEIMMLMIYFVNQEINIIIIMMLIIIMEEVADIFIPILKVLKTNIYMTDG